MTLQRRQAFTAWHIGLLPLLSLLCLAASAGGSAESAGSAAVPSWDYTGFERFPALWFGANASGLHSDTSLALIRRHSLAGLGWQQGTQARNFRHAENALAQAVMQLKMPPPPTGKAATLTPAPAPATFVYRHFQMAWSIFDLPRAQAENDALDAAFLRDADGKGHRCQQDSQNASSPLYVYHGGNGSGMASPAAQLWLSDVVDEVAAEADADAVFFDETDWSYCGYNFKRDNCSRLSPSFLIADQQAKYAVLAATAQALNAAGKWPIFSSKNYFNASRAGLPASFDWGCLLPLEGYAAALQNSSWARFEEYWMSAGGRDVQALQIDTALRLAAQGVPTVARAMANATCSDGIAADAGEGGEGGVGTFAAPAVLRGAATRPGMRQDTVTPVELAYAMAAFLIVQSPYSFFGYSSGWYDEDWCWHGKEYEADYGRPLAPATRHSTYAWTRNYTGCDVEIDVSAGTSAVRLKKGGAGGP